MLSMHDAVAQKAADRCIEIVDRTIPCDAGVPAASIGSVELQWYTRCTVHTRQGAALTSSMGL